MQKSDNTSKAVNAHRRVRTSTTLNRRYVKRPTLSGDITVPIKRSPKLKHFASDPLPTTHAKRSAQQEKEMITAAVQHPLQISANQKLQARQNATKPQPRPTMSAKEIKEQAIKKAIASAGKIESIRQQEEDGVKHKFHFSFGRIMLALSCAALAVFSIVYFVNLNMPDLSLKVAAMQTGINASYPNYIPKDYSTSSVSSEDGRVILSFKSNTSDDKFTIVEEVSSWDSSALLANYVKDEFGENYSTVREQGLTIYVSGSNATWVNGGILYKINAQDNTLSARQIRSIAVSL